MKKHYKTAIVWKNIGIIILFIVGFLGIPLVFCVIFSDGKYSRLFGFISCNMSTENWFSFWITYLAAISSATVAIVSLRLTKKIEEIQLIHQFEEERLKFRILQIQETDNANELKVILPMEIVSINNVVITYASISFGHGECLVLFSSESENDCIPLKGSSFSLKRPQKMGEQCDIAWQLWYKQQSTRTRAYLYAELSIWFRYPMASLGNNKKNQLVCSKAKVSIKLDKYNVEYYDISDRAVFNPETLQSM